MKNMGSLLLDRQVRYMTERSMGSLQVVVSVVV